MGTGGPVCSNKPRRMLYSPESYILLSQVATARGSNLTQLPT
jgi:hypothetical protein